MKKIAGLLMVCIIVLSFVGCNSNTIQNQNTTNQTKQMKKELVIVTTGGNITTLDPNSTWAYECNEIFRMVFDTLLTIKDGVYSPGIATKWDWVDDECTTLHCVLRDDVYFSNGEKLTAEDVAYSFDRCTYGSVASYYDHCNVISDTEIEIVLSKPCVEILYFLADTATSIVCKKACESDGEWGHTVGSGPYIIDLDSFLPGDSISLIMNRKYWGEKPITEKFTFRTIKDSSAALIALQNGEVDFIPEVASTEIDVANSDKSIVTNTYVSSSINYLAFNTVNGGNLTDLNLRKAVAYAIDKDQLRVAASQEEGKNAGSMWGWNEPGYFDEFDEVYTYNPEKAKEFVALVKDPNFTIMYNTSSSIHKNCALMIKELCGEVGINVDLKESDAAGISASTKWGSATHELLIYNISLGDSDTSIWEFYLEGATKNRAFCSDPTVQKLLSQAAATQDNANIYADIQTINNDVIYYLPLFYNTKTYAFGEGFDGMVLRMTGGNDFTYAYREQ